MGKRSDFKRRKQDAYYTPPEAVEPLLAHLYAGTYIDPCCGDGAIERALDALGGPTCVWASDIEEDARVSNYGVAQHMFPVDVFITNPPWTREILHPIIENLCSQLPTWLLFDAAWAHTKQAIPYKNHCKKIVSVGRVSWMQNGVSSLDDCAWYLFDAKFTGQTEFYWR